MHGDGLLEMRAEANRESCSGDMLSKKAATGSKRIPRDQRFPFLFVNAAMVRSHDSLALHLLVELLCDLTMSVDRSHPEIADDSSSSSSCGSCIDSFNCMFLAVQNRRILQERIHK